MSEIEWFQIPGFTAYRVNSKGEIWSCLKQQGRGFNKETCQFDTGTPRRKLKPERRKYDNRKRYTLKADSGKYVRKYGSYFVLLATVGPKPVGMEACHNDGDCTNDKPTNLRWDTVVNNKNDMRKHGTLLRGETSGVSKLTEKQVVEILTSNQTRSELGKKFGVTPENIWCIQSRKTWRHIKVN
jgi:hypothetical protein